MLVDEKSVIVTKFRYFQVFDWDYITSNDEIGEVQVIDNISDHDDHPFCNDLPFCNDFPFCNDLLHEVPLSQVDLVDGEEQWRLLHRMTGPRDQVIIILICQHLIQGIK